MGRKSSLTPERLAKDINFFTGYCADVSIELFNTNEQSVNEFISKYEYEDCEIIKVSNTDQDDLFRIYSSGSKQIRSLCNTISEDFDVISVEILTLEES